MEWYLKVLKNYTKFDGRARRKEYWMFTLFNFIISLVLTLFIAELLFLYNLAVLIPGLAVAVRRLHDTGRSGWWVLISLIPLIGFIILLVYLLEDSEDGSNQYGPNPKKGEESEENFSDSEESIDTDKEQSDVITGNKEVEKEKAKAGDQYQTEEKNEEVKEEAKEEQSENIVNYCSECGEKVSQDDAYCNNCGNKLSF